MWNTRIQFQLPFDINLVVKNLATGQVAEAQITNYDQYGRPHGGTILIDADANGIGWFIVKLSLFRYSPSNLIVATWKFLYF
ncbi:MAG: hypothetical protein V7L14_00980 [Nostoc sp.]|uniref:hypothetical protein n=1 Tax=Nostoc sp. TaxID=1180 RepID=UPI002FF906E9